MRTMFLVALAALLTTLAAWGQSGASVTIDLDGGPPVVLAPSPRQLVALQAALAVHNAQARRDEPPLSLNAWVASWVTDQARAATRTLAESDRARACRAFAALSDAERSAILAQLGVSPCAE
jgi:hypothetical protein